MDSFHYTHAPGMSGPTLAAEGVPCEAIAAAVGTPCFVYARATIAGHVERLTAAFAPLRPRLCYAVKASNNLQLLRLLVGLGCGMDVVSVGELERAFLAGCPMDRVVFAGVGKTASDIAAALSGAHSPLAGTNLDPGAALRARGPIGAFNCESASELALIADVARQLGLRARVAMRINPEVDARAHAHTTTAVKGVKFGVTPRQALELFDHARAHPHITLDGLHAHLGSPMYDPATIASGVARLLDLADTLATRGHAVRQLDIGGGIGADYISGQTPPYDDFARALTPLLAPRVQAGLSIILEPGRTIVANAGLLLTRVQHVKPSGDDPARAIIVCDAGMNVLLRPALYDAFHFIWPVTPAGGMVPRARAPHAGLDPAAAASLHTADVVGPICETGDFLARSRPLPPVQRGGLLAVFTAGAYAMSMASTYNDHPLPAEVLVDATTATLIRPRQTIAELMSPSTAAHPLFHA